jgi:hypothetical protein
MPKPLNILILLKIHRRICNEKNQGKHITGHSE